MSYVFWCKTDGNDTFPDQLTREYLGDYSDTYYMLPAQYEDWCGAHRNPDFIPETVFGNMANGNFGAFMDEMLDPSGELVEVREIQIDLAIERMEAWLIAHPDITDHNDIDSCTPEYISMRVTQYLPKVKFGKLHGATHLGWG